jgi:hypothetical protein
MKNQERPSLFVGWVHKGRKSFEVIPESQYGALLKKLLLEKHVHPRRHIHFQNDHMPLD